MDWKFRQEMSARTYKDFVCLSERLLKNCENTGEKRAIFATASKERPFAFGEESSLRAASGDKHTKSVTTSSPAGISRGA